MQPLMSGRAHVVGVEAIMGAWPALSRVGRKWDWRSLLSQGEQLAHRVSMPGMPCAPRGHAHLIDAAQRPRVRTAMLHARCSSSAVAGTRGADGVGGDGRGFQAVVEATGGRK